MLKTKNKRHTRQSKPINLRSDQHYAKEKNYLLDGHYRLLTGNNEVVNIPLKTFEKINPFSLNLILDDISKIKKRLETKDNKTYYYGLFERLQNEEMTYAKYLSKTLGITLNIGTQNDYSELLLLLRKMLTTK